MEEKEDERKTCQLALGLGLGIPAILGYFGARRPRKLKSLFILPRKIRIAAIFCYFLAVRPHKVNILSILRSAPGLVDRGVLLA